MDIFRHFKRSKAALPSDWQERITPGFCLNPSGQRNLRVRMPYNSGRHWDGASAFALKHFGAVFGQREGAQGQSYAIPTIGGTIGLKAIGESVMRFTEYAAAHPELRFLVTAIGCGGGDGIRHRLPRCSARRHYCQMYGFHRISGISFMRN